MCNVRAWELGRGANSRLHLVGFQSAKPQKRRKRKRFGRDCHAETHLWTQCLQAKRNTVRSQFPPNPAKARHMPPPNLVRLGQIPSSNSPAESCQDFNVPPNPFVCLFGRVCGFQGNPLMRRELDSAPLVNLKLPPIQTAGCY